MIDWSSLPDVAVQALLYGFLGTLGGGLVTWAAGRHLLTKPWRELVALWRQHNASQQQLADAHAALAAHLAGPTNHTREETPMETPIFVVYTYETVNGELVCHVYGRGVEWSQTEAEGFLQALQDGNPGLQGMVLPFEDPIVPAETIAPRSTGSETYPVPVPKWTPSPGFPPLPDKDALDYLASTVLGDQDSNNPYVVEAAMLTVLRTGRQIQTYSGD